MTVLKHCSRFGLLAPGGTARQSFYFARSRLAPSSANLIQETQQGSRTCCDHLSQTSVCKSTGNGGSGTPAEPARPQVNLTSTPEFFIRLILYSLIGSITVKYGSLLIDVPFQPNAIIALALILAPTAVFSAVLAAISSKGKADS